MAAGYSEGTLLLSKEVELRVHSARDGCPYVVLRTMWSMGTQESLSAARVKERDPHGAQFPLPLC